MPILFLLTFCPSMGARIGLDVEELEKEDRFLPSLHEEYSSAVVATQDSVSYCGAVPLNPATDPRIQSAFVNGQPSTSRDEHRNYCFGIDVAAAGHLQGSFHGSLDDRNKFALRVLDIELHYRDRHDRRVRVRQFYLR